MPRRTYSVYILASHSRCLYVGVTNNLARRLVEHRLRRNPGSFTARYRITKLVYFEQTHDIGAAIAREHQVKRWRREKRVRLIEAHNPEWRELAH